VLAALVIPALPAGAQAPTSCELERLNWMEVRELVPARINTVILSIGTLEAHGAAANGTDILAPLAMAREIAAKVNALVAPVVPYGFTIKRWDLAGL
jgi:creatinine amidohydrolase